MADLARGKARQAASRASEFDTRSINSAKYSHGLRARKVKCDQAKPFCNRCRNADRICQGYEDVFVSTQTLTTKFGGSRSRSEEAPARIIIRSPSHDPCLGPNEARSLAFYVEKVGTYLGGAADIQFWGKSLPRLGQSEPAIKLCVVTVSNLFETQAKTDLPDSWEAQEAELHQAELYNKALSTTAERLKKDEGDVVALATCALLLAYYVMQGDEEQAVRLYHSGAPVIKKLLVRACSNQYPAAHEIAGIFLQFFERIAFAVKRFNMNVDFMNSEEVVAYTLKVNGSSDFRDCYDARQRLYRTMDIGYQLVEDTRDYRSGLQDLLDDDPMLEAWRARRAETIAIYSQWMDLFNRYCSRSKSDPEEAWLLSNCRMTFLTSHTYVVACLERNETNWLGQIEHFRTVVEEAEKMISYRSMRNTHFTFEAVFMVPLFLTAIKCRDLGIRYRALAAMRHSAYKEGLFKREEMIAMATRVVHLETLSDQTITGGFTFPPNGLVFDARKMSTETGVTRVAFRAKLGDAPDMWAAWEEDLVLSEHRFSTTELVERRLKPASIA